MVDLFIHLFHINDVFPLKNHDLRKPVCSITVQLQVVLQIYYHKAV